MTVGYPDWSGTRLLHGTQQLLQTTDGPLAPGTSKSHTIPVTRPGYILELHAFNSTNNTAKLPFSVIMRWEDGVSGDGLDTQSWYALAGTVAGPHFINGSGPTKGGQLVLTIANLASSGPSLEYFLIVDETSFAYVRHDWRTDDIFSFNPTGYTAPAQDVNAGILAVLAGTSIPANTTSNFVLPLYNGPVYVQGGNSGAAASMELAIALEAEPGGLVGGPTFDQFNDAAGNIYAAGMMSRIQSLLQVTNHTASPFNAFACVSILER